MGLGEVGNEVANEMENGVGGAQGIWRRIGWQWVERLKNSPQALTLLCMRSGAQHQSNISWTFSVADTFSVSSCAAPVHVHYT